MIYTIENAFLRVEINALGAELWSIFDKKTGTEHLWQGDPAWWPRRAPTLFPICGRLVEGGAPIDGQKYALPMHGFVRDFVHEVVQQQPESIRFSYEPDQEMKKLYPFAFRFETVFTLDGTKLTQTFEVQNTDTKVLPFSVGYHTGYACPFDGAHSTGDYSLVFSTKEHADRLLGNGLLSGERVPYLQGEDTIVLKENFFAGGSIILTGLKSEFITIVERDSGRAVKVGIKDFPYLVLWSYEQGNAAYICIEPWYGLPDTEGFSGEFSQKVGIQQITPGEKFSCSQTIEIEGEKR